MFTFSIFKPAARHRRTFSTATSAIAAIAVLAAMALVAGLSSCGVRYYSATVSGYVRESQADANGNQAGINGAEVLVYVVDPSTDSTATPMIRTSTMTSGNNSGYWSHKIMWTTSSPLFADEGDSGTVWVRIMRKGYFPDTVKVSGILSDSSNVVPTIELEKIVTTKLKGRVVNDKGVGVDGVNVVLDLQSTAENKADYSATTATVNGVVGVFTFTDIAWEDSDSIPAEPKALRRRAIADGKATESVKLYIDDANYYSDSNYPASVSPEEALAKHYSASVEAFGITSGEQEVDRSLKPITVYSSTFSVPLIKGRVTKADGTTGLNKVTMALRFPIQGGNPQTVTTSSLAGEDGWFQFDSTMATWVNNRPTHSAAGKQDDMTEALIYVNDGNFYSTNDVDKPVSQVVSSGTSLNLAALTKPVTIVAGSSQFTATSVKGQLLFKDKGVGVNGTTISLALASNANNPLSTQTATVSSKDGVFEFKNVSWTDTKPTIDANGNASSTQIARIYLNDNNFNSETVQASPLQVTLKSGDALDLTDPAAAIPLFATRRNFSCPKVSGKVLASQTTNGVAGITVVLHRMADAGNANDLNTTTDKDGNFAFNNVAWSDTKPDTATSDTTDIKLTAQGQNYAETSPLAVQTIQSDTAAGDSSWTISVRRTTVWNFSVTLTGSAKRTTTVGSTTSTATLPGTNVSIKPIPTSAQLAANIVTQDPVITSTDGNGNYTATISWSLDSSYSPPSDAAANGGDILPLRVTFVESTYGTLVVPTDGTADANGTHGTANAPYNLLSWSNNNNVNCTYTN